MTGEAEIINPPDRYLLTLEWIVLGALSLLGLVMYAISGRSLPLVGATSLGLISLGVGYYRQCVQRPKSVSVRGDGIVLRFRLRQDRFFPWDDIEGVYSKPGPERTKWGRNIGKGGIKLRSTGAFFLVTYPISQTIISGYTKANGRRPYTWDGS